ncbi:MAG: hypothetical protein ACI84C_002538 [Flavobacteriales bacterium]|jgi:hypothetical protein
MNRLLIVPVLHVAAACSQNQNTNEEEESAALEFNLILGCSKWIFKG